MARQIQGSQRDFSFGEIDVDLKRSDDHPARARGLRQMANARIHNSNAISNRSGRRALFIETGRIDEVLMSPGNIFYLAFGNGYLHVYNAAGAQVFASVLKGDGATAISWTTATLSKIVWVIGPGPQRYSIYITYDDGTTTNVPQILTWDGVSQISTWTLATYVESLVGGFQKQTPFYRLSPPGITMAASNNGPPGTSISISFSGDVLVPGMVGTRMRYCGRQILITAVASTVGGTATVEQNLPLGMELTFATDPASILNAGDVIEGAGSGAQGVVVSFIGGGSHIMIVQLLQNGAAQIPSFISGETIVGPSGSLAVTAISFVTPQAVVAWDDEVMNTFRGYPTSCFVDQNRLGFCNFPALRNGICWSAISTPANLLPGPNPDDSIFEIAPNKSQVLYVVPGPESSEFVFCTTGVFYIPISPTNPLKPGSVAFQLLSGDGSAQVQPRVSQEAILYVNAGQNSMMAVIATGAYLRPFNTKSLSDYHSHLFNAIQCIAAPSADGTFNERYAYVLNGDGSIAVGKYKSETLPGNEPVVGWGPWSGAGAVNWISARSSNVLFSSNYFGTGIVEVLDDAQYLDATVSVNALPAALTPPVGKGPLWFIPGQSVTLIDQGTRMMGTYQIDANGSIVPQFNGGEDLTVASLVAGQPWTMVTEPFSPDASPGADQHQRMLVRRISYLAVYVIHSTGFMLAKLFSSKQTATSPPLGSVVNVRRIPAWNLGDDPTKPPPSRETVEDWRPLGLSYDPRVAIIKDTPGPLFISEIAMEITL